MTPLKRSSVAEASVIGGVERVDLAVEAGPLPMEGPALGALVPEPHHAEVPDAGAREELLELARLLADELGRRSGLEYSQVGVRIREALVEEDGRTRRITTAQVLLGVGSDQPFPAWTRIVGLDPGRRTWPVPLLDAIERAAFEARWPEAPSPPTPRGDEGTLLDAFAVADLLRVLIPRWEQSAGRGERVAAEGIAVREGGDPFDGVSAGGSSALVDDGRWVAAEDPPRSLVRGSWREYPRAGRHSLVLDGPRLGSDAWRAASRVVTRVFVLGGGLWVAGVSFRNGHPVARFGPEPLPPHSRPLERVEARAGDPFWDLGGLPVRTAALWAGPIFPSR